MPMVEGACAVSQSNQIGHTVRSVIACSSVIRDTHTQHVFVGCSSFACAANARKPTSILYLGLTDTKKELYELYKGEMERMV